MKAQEEMKALRSTRKLVATYRERSGWLGRRFALTLVMLNNISFESTVGDGSERIRPRSDTLASLGYQGQKSLGGQ